MENNDESDSLNDWQNFLNYISLNAEEIGIINDVEKAQSLREKVQICYDTDFVYDGLKQWLRVCLQRPIATKKSSVAERFRLKGNAHIKSNDKVTALLCYNRSLFYAPKDSDELRSAYGNRSFVLMEMKHYSECIKDIDRGIMRNESDLRKIKLLARKGQALMALTKYSEANESFEEAISVSKNLCEHLERKSQKVVTEIKSLLKKIPANYNGNQKLSSPEDDSNAMKGPNLNFVENADFGSASKTVNLVRSAVKGRYVTANDDIKVGDVLFVERPFAFVVLPELSDKYCSYCCKAVCVPVPCENCPLACFCNETCRDSAQETFHKWECGGLEVCYSIGIVHLALRVALLGMLDENKEKYKEVSGLMSHLEESSASDVFNYAVTATLLIVYFEEYTKLFEGLQRRERLLNFGGKLLLHIAQLICNGHAITDIETKSDSVSSLLIENQVRVATAIYPSASMMNHSCDPSIVNSFFESLLIVRASKDLKKGDEVYNCYGPMVQKMSYEERQELLLSQYKFVCDCQSCENKMGPVSDGVICQYCSSQLLFGSKACSKCSKEVNMEALKSEFDAAKDNFEKGSDLLAARKFSDAYDLFKKALSTYLKHCHKNHKKNLDCRDRLACVCANMGKFWNIALNWEVEVSSY
ncbi:SET and MYND domain-containing protein 4 isoform X2 [Halyomorpha halys]|uniref:SET and MYND domain-containing protein 4 isoform X2 n=1 Tax=Halyomorpha halys TaxID=286706 RepID=UPI0006D4CA3B|nr:SET and MYND domain-containing protein 4 isoform X2 [Halyomorpha halys]